MFENRKEAKAKKQQLEELRELQSYVHINLIELQYQFSELEKLFKEYNMDSYEEIDEIKKDINKLNLLNTSPFYLAISDYDDKKEVEADIMPFLMKVDEFQGKSFRLEQIGEESGGFIYVQPIKEYHNQYIKAYKQVDIMIESGEDLLPQAIDQFKKAKQVLDNRLELVIYTKKKIVDDLNSTEVSDYLETKKLLNLF